MGHPAYREKFADNLKRELPRIPLAPPLACGTGFQPVESQVENLCHKSSGFRAFAEASSSPG